MKLAITISEPAEWAWIDALTPHSGQLDAVILHPSGSSGGDGRYPISEIPFHDQLPGGNVQVPVLSNIVAELRNVSACLLFSNGSFARAVRLGAELLDLPVFSVISTSDDLTNAKRTQRARPDLFFITNAFLLPQALADARYGLTMFPTGEVIPPAHTLETQPGSLEGHQVAAARMLAVISRWEQETLDERPPALSVVVPAYKEGKNLTLVSDRLITALEPSGIAYEVLLVDDASPDDTYQKAIEQMWKSPRIRALTKTTPRGMGNAIRHGISNARAPVIAVTMGDGSDDVSKLPEMFRKISDEGYALVIGCRYRRRENYETIPMLYRFWSRLFRLTTWILLGLRLKDYTNAFRMFHRRIFTRYGPESGGFEISPEITFKGWFSSRRVTEVDVRHLKRASGQSNFSFLRAGPGYGRILLKAFVHRLTGRWFTLEW